MPDNYDAESPPNNVLLLEDEEADRLAVRLQLEVMGFVVYDTASPIEAKEIFLQRDFSLVIIHVSSLPLRGLELCRWIRAASTVPILMLTQRDEVIDEAMVMSAGADDYVSKPIDSKILTSRINQQISRGQSQRAPRANILIWGPLRMDLSAHQFTIDDAELHLTNTEYQFLQLLMENPHRIFTRGQILEAIGVMKGLGTNQLIDTHASRIRKKIRESGGPDVITVVRSVGFRLADATKPLIEV
jgi:two-component system response regulator RegX3